MAEEQQKKLIGFDVDETLVTGGKRVYVECMKRASAEYGYDIPLKEVSQRMDLIWGATHSRHVAELTGEAIDSERTRKIGSFYIRLLQKQYPERVKPIEGVSDTLAE